MPTRATTDHQEIQEWATLHDLRPVEVVATKHDSEPPQLAFAAASEIRGDLRALPWDQFLAFFSLQDLALVYDVGLDDEPGTSLYEIVHNRPKSGREYQRTQA